MVIPVTQFFSASRILPTQSRNRPILNQIPYSSTANPSLIGSRRVNYTQFWQDFRNNPELMSPITIMVTDIIGDRPSFVSNDGNDNPLGRNKRIDAQKFWQNNRGKETIKAMLYDMFVTGDGYIWKGEPGVKEISSKINLMASRFKSRLPTETYNKLVIKTMQDEDMKLPKKFDYIASSTVEIESSNYEIIGYVQKTRGQFEEFSTKQVIHFRMNTINGMVEGFAPLESLSAEISLLWLVKGNMVAIMRNSGSPDKIFILSKEQAGSKNHQALEEQLQQYNQILNRHGNMVFTGEVKVEDKSQFKDMEYKELALYLTSNIAYAYGVPVSRVPYLIGSAANKGDSGGMAESGYWKRISEIQDEVEDLLNNQMFGKMGWYIRFNRSYKQDEVRESQVSSMNADTIQKYQSIGREYKKKPTLQKVNQLINFSDDDWEDIPKEELLGDIEKTGMMNQNMLSKLETQKEPDNRKRADTKRNSANQKGVESASV